MIRKYPSLLLLLFIVSGIVVADQTRLPSWMFLFGTLVLCLAGFVSLSRNNNKASTIALGFSLLFFSAFHFSIRFYDVGPRHVAHVLDEGKRYHIFGKVSDWPDLKTNRTEVKISLDSVTAEVTQKVHGDILLKISDTTTALQRGDRIEFYGRVWPIRGGGGPGQFDYRRYLHLKGVFGIAYLSTLLDVRIDKANRFGLFNYIDKLRAIIRNSFYRNLSPEAAALAAGFLIGETRDISTNVYKRFRDTGTLHVLAVSGSNVALVILSFIILLRPFSLSPRKRAVVLLVVVFVFALLSYEEPSVLRASLMATLVIVASMLQRRYDLNNVIAATAVIILLFDPMQLFDVGFQLSFAAAWGLIFFTPRISERFRRYHARWWYRWLVLPLIVSIVAWVCSTPLIALYFHRIPAISLVANLIVVPLVSIAVMGVVLLLMADLIWAALGMLIGSLLNQLLTFIVFILGVLGGDNALLFRVAYLPSWIVLLFYGYLFVAFWSLKSKRVRRLALISLIAVLNVSLLAGSLSSGTQTDRTNVYLFTVPSGIIAFVKQGDSDQGDIIVTGLTGRDYQIEDRIIFPILEGLKIKRINSLFVISADFNALDDMVRLAEAYGVETIYIPGELEKSLTDVVRISFSDRVTARIVPCPNDLPKLKVAGYYPSRRGVLAHFGSASVLFTDRIKPDRLTSFPRLGQQVLVVGQQLEADSSFWNTLHDAGYTQVVCSRIKQPASSLLDGAATPSGDAVPDFVHDLSELGTLRVQITQNQSTPVQIAPLH